MLSKITKGKTSCIVFFFCIVNFFIIFRDSDENIEEFDALDYSYDKPYDLEKKNEQNQETNKYEEPAEIITTTTTSAPQINTSGIRVKNVRKEDYDKWVQNHQDFLVDNGNLPTIRQIMEERKVTFEKKKNKLSLKPMSPFHYKISAGYSMTEFLRKYNQTCQSKNVTVSNKLNKSMCPCLPQGLGKSDE